MNTAPAPNTLRTPLLFRELRRLRENDFITGPYFVIDGGKAQYGEQVVWGIYYDVDVQLGHGIKIYPYALVNADKVPTELRSFRDQDHFSFALKGASFFRSTPHEVDDAKRKREVNLIAALTTRMAADTQALANARLRLQQMHPHATT